MDEKIKKAMKDSPCEYCKKNTLKECRFLREMNKITRRWFAEIKSIKFGGGGFTCFEPQEDTDFDIEEYNIKHGY